MAIRLLATAGTRDGYDTLVGVDPDGVLRWYRHASAVRNAGAGTSVYAGWHQTSGNPIGKGWGGFTFLGAALDIDAGTIVLAGVDSDGNLRSYYYIGNGESDVDGNQNWGPASGAVMANSFGGWKHLVLLSYLPDLTEGDEILQFLAVDHAGDAWFYQFDNHVLAHTPAVIASGWTDFQYLFCDGGQRVYAVTNSGVLHFFDLYVGYDETGAVQVQFGPNNGNAIGAGWNKFISATATWLQKDPTTGQPFLHIYVTDGAHNLLWYRYTGFGVEDPDGSRGFDPGSGAIISGSW
jgi:hypothetical protein